MAFKLGMTVDMLVSMTLDWMQGHSGLAEETIQRWIISTTKQAITIKRAAMGGHYKFHFSFKSSVPVVLNYGHTSKSCKIYNVGSLVSQCLLSERAFGVQTKDVILPSRWSVI